MKIWKGEQKTKEWFDLKVGKISGTRFAKVISGKKNRLIYELMNEKLNGYIDEVDLSNEDVQYGVENEDLAIQLYSEKSGIKFKKVGAILSDLDNHISSPDSISECETIALEIKCTMKGDIHLERYFEGIDEKYLPQCINYFAVDKGIKEVHFISYCGYRPERPLVIHILKRNDYLVQIEKGLTNIKAIGVSVENKLREWNF